jgi:hypothetical protein
VTTFTAHGVCPKKNRRTQVVYRLLLDHQVDEPPEGTTTARLDLPVHAKYENRRCQFARIFRTVGATWEIG